jgi:quercetin dioxygenase-like cupin family protein
MRRTELYEAPLTAERGVVLAMVELMPGDAAPRHMHHGDEMLYVLEGSVVVEVEGCAPRTLRAGESVQFPRDTPHFARNPSADEPARVVASIISIAGRPSTVIAPVVPTSAA